MAHYFLRICQTRGTNLKHMYYNAFLIILRRAAKIRRTIIKEVIGVQTLLHRILNSNNNSYETPFNLDTVLITLVILRLTKLRTLGQLRTREVFPQKAPLSDLNKRWVHWTDWNKYSQILKDNGMALTALFLVELVLLTSLIRREHLWFPSHLSRRKSAKGILIRYSLRLKSSRMKPQDSTAQVPQIQGLWVEWLQALHKVPHSLNKQQLLHLLHQEMAFSMEVPLEPQ